MDLQRLIEINSEIGALLQTLQICDITEVNNLLKKKTTEFCQILVGDIPEVSKKDDTLSQASDDDTSTRMQLSRTEISTPSETDVEDVVPELASEPIATTVDSQPTVPSAINISASDQDASDVPLAPVVNVAIIEESTYEGQIFTAMPHKRSHGKQQQPQQPLLFASANEPTQDQVRIEDMLAQKETADFSKSFSINDKYRYIREIFNNNVNDFNSAVSKVGSMGSLHEAYDYFLNELGWEADDETVAEFLQKVANHFNAVQ